VNRDDASVIGRLQDRAFEPPFEDDHARECPTAHDADKICICGVLADELAEQAHDFRSDR
jgi:hypothetical protein